MRHAHQKTTIFAPTIFVFLPSQIFGASDLPAAGFPDFLGCPRSVDVHLDLVDGAHVRLRVENMSFHAADVADRAVHVVERELRDSADSFGGESGVVLVADVVEPVGLALAGVVRVAVEDGAVARCVASLRLFLESAWQDLKTDEGVLVIGELKGRKTRVKVLEKLDLLK